MGDATKALIKSSEPNTEKVASQKPKKDFFQSISSPLEQIMFLQRTIGNQAVVGLLRSGALNTKPGIVQPDDLRLESSDDAYEHKVDRVAEQVMRMREQPKEIRCGYQPVQRAPQEGWPDAAKSGATSKRISQPPGGSWNKDTVKIGSILRIPVAGLIHGSQRKDQKDKALWDDQASARDVTEESSAGRAIVLVPDPLTTETVDVLLYMHGFGIGFRQRAIARETERKKGGKKVIEVVEGMEVGTVRDVEVDRMEEQLENFIKASNRPMVAVLPQGAYRSQKGSKKGEKPYIPYIPSFGSNFNSDIYLTEVFGKVGKLQGIKPGRVILGGHSGAGGTIAPMLGEAVNKGKRDDTQIKKDGGLRLPSGLAEVVLFDAINSDTELEHIENWVKAHIKKDVQELKVKSEPDDQKAYLKGSMRFRAYHSNLKGYTKTYNKLRKDIKKAINDELKNARLTLGSDVEEALRENYHDEPKGVDTSAVDTGHESIMGKGKIEEALGALISPVAVQREPLHGANTLRPLTEVEIPQVLIS